MIIAIDGPAGAGKSTTAKAVANRLGYAYIDTGAMYRAVALSVLEQALEAEDEPSVVALANELPLCFEENGTRICIDRRDVSGLIRTQEIGELTSKIASLPGLREVIVAQQRRIARDSESTCGGAVLEGRDIQTVVFPDAPGQSVPHRRCEYSCVPASWPVAGENRCARYRCRSSATRHHRA
jgi:cytidylate kinase